MKTILVHFDAPDFVLLDTFVGTALAAKRAVQAINVEYFDNSVHFELIILPPKPGSLKQYIGFVVKGATSLSLITLTLVQFMDSKSVQDISKELYGKTPSEVIIKKIRNFKSQAESTGKSTEELEENGREILEEIASISTRSALEIERHDLERANIPEDLRYELEASQSDLFKAAMDDASVMAIGFDESDDFPISRNSFPSRAIRPKRPELKLEDDDCWEVTIIEIVVISPNFVESDQGQRKWKGKTIEDKTVLFVVDDKDFWAKLHKHDVTFGENDRITAQLATRFVNDRPRENRVVRVLKFNQTKIGAELNENALTVILGDLRSSQKRNSAQPSLFD